MPLLLCCNIALICVGQELPGSQIIVEYHVNRFVQNPTDFSVQCGRQKRPCAAVRESVLFLDGGNELGAVDRLQMKCGYVVIVPDTPAGDRALLYHTSCQLMTDVVTQIFRDCLEAPVSLPQYASEMSLGELHRHRVTVSYDDCKARVNDFDFQGGSWK